MTLTYLSKASELVSRFSFQESCWFKIEASFPNVEWFPAGEDYAKFFVFIFILYLSLFYHKSFNDFLLILG